jgi:hypothetical protein
LKLRVSGTKSELAERIINYFYPQIYSQPNIIFPNSLLLDKREEYSKSGKTNINFPTTNQIFINEYPTNSSLFSNLPKQTNFNIFNLIKTNDPNGIYLPRIFHSSVVYKDKMYVFGGLPVKGCKEPGHRLGLRVYDFVSNSWVVITTTGQEPPLPCKVENFKIFFLNYC